LLLLTLLAGTVSPKALAEPGSGDKAAEALFGLAAVMATSSAMFAAYSASQTDQQNAELKAQTQKELTAMSARVSQYQSNQLRGIALQQSAIARDIAANGQAAATDRQQSQIVELSDARLQKAMFDKQSRDFRQNLELQKLEVAKQQTDSATSLVEQQMRLQISQLTGNAPAAAPTIAPQGVASTQPITPQNSVALTGRAAGAQRLLASVSGEKWDGRRLTKITAAVTPAPAPVSAPTVRRAAAPEEKFVVKALQMTMAQNREARGSTRGVRVSQAKADESSSGSDLSRFVSSSTTTQSGDSFSDYLRRNEVRPQPVTVPPVVVEPVVENRGHRGGAYNAPSDVSANETSGISLRRRIP